MRCLVSFGFLAEENEPQKGEDRVRPDQLRYAHFEVEVNSDGYPKILGAGAMAVTYCARDTVLNSKVALKVISRKLAENPTARARFLREARAAAQIHHPNVARVMHYGEQAGECFYAMELVHGETLEARVQRDGPLPLNVALEIVEQTARGLAAGEVCGVVHRDLKPSNLMIESDPSDQLIVKIIDYGVAKVMAGDNPTVQTQAGFIGTPAFASPEQFDEAGTLQIDTRSDVYSLGTTFWYLLTGRGPFAGKSIEEIRTKQAQQLPLGQLKSAHAPAQVVALLKSMLNVDPSKRPQTAKELLTVVQRCHTRFEPSARRRRKQLVVAAGMLMLIGLAAYFYQRARSPSDLDKSIAVLPFENLTPNAEDQFFTVGIQDQILTKLASLAELKVISRTSTQKYQSKPSDLKAIGQQLGVGRVLEGSVQRAADKVRVNVQLIDVRTDTHLWADTFDRKLTDIFSVETEVAKAIAEQLRARITGREERVIAAKPTDNPEAYDAYLRGLAYYLKSANTPANALGAQRYLGEAIRLDPKFALAWALLSTVEARGYSTQALQPTLSLREHVRQAAETALTLQPNLGEALVAKGYYYYACLKDYDTAVRYFEQARQLLPNSSHIPESLAYVERRRGRYNESESYFNEAERLDPRNLTLLTQHALSYSNLRRFPEALRKFDQILNIAPDDVDTIVFKAAIAQAEGDLPRAAALLTPIRPAADDISALETQLYQAILERRPGPIISRVTEILAEPDPALGYYNGELRFWLGWAQDVTGDHAAAQGSWQRARSELEPFLKQQPENYNLIGILALTNVGLRDKASALALAERAMAVISLEKDAASGPTPIDVFARVAAQLGEPDRAIAALNKLLSIPYASPMAANVPLTAALLRLDPMFDSLRSDPRFQAFLKNPPPAHY